MRKLLSTTLLLTSLVLLSGCGGAPAGIASAELCKSWRHQTVSKGDQLTDATASGIEGSNNARTAWGCKYGSSKAKG